MLFAYPVSTKAQGNSFGNQGQQVDDVPALRNSIRNLEQVQERVNNPEVGSQIQETVQNQQRIQERIETKLQNLQGRPGFLKFLIGPDYKNAGEIRSEIVQLQNQQRQLERVREQLNQEDQEIIDEAIAEIDANINQLQTKLEESLSGFSLFGWLNKFLSNL